MGGTSNSEISGNKTAPESGISDIWILKLDLNGNLISDKSFSIGNNAQTLITDFKAIDEDRILITLSGAAQNNTAINFSNGIFNQHIINGEIDYLLLELDYNLNITYKHTIGGAGSDVATGLFDFNNRMFVSGVSNSDIGFDKQVSNFGGLDNWVVVLNDLLSLKQPYQQIDVSVFPNPSNGIINLQMNEWTNQQGSISAFVSDMSGRNVAVFQNLDLANTLNLSHLRAGHYLLNLVQNGSKIYTHKLVIGD